MEQPIEDEVYYYYDAHPTEEDLMGESPPHSRLVHYLIEVLIWLLRRQVCAVHENYNFYRTTDEHERPLVPDIAIIRGIPRSHTRSYREGISGPPPQVVFEFASEETWRKDLLNKPGAYQRMGVEEYYAYDPNWPALPLSRRRGQRLFGWQRDRKTGILREMPLDSDGRLWSPFLQSFLVPEGELLSLTDRFGNQRLTQGKAEKKRADTEAERAEAERERAEEAIQRIEIMAKRLRELGEDPDQLM